MAESQGNSDKEPKKAGGHCTGNYISTQKFYKHGLSLIWLKTFKTGTLPKSWFVTKMIMSKLFPSIFLFCKRKVLFIITHGVYQFIVHWLIPAKTIESAQIKQRKVAPKTMS